MTRLMLSPRTFLILLCGFALVFAVSGSRAQDADPPAGDISRGLDVFEAQCFDCHNADNDVYKSGPGFKGTKNGKLPSGKEATREGLLQIIDEGCEGGQMPSFRDVLSPSQKEDVIAYVLSR
jgi:mono/diheme cytochrome c family protein